MQTTPTPAGGFEIPDMLQNEWVTMRLLLQSDFESLHQAASDPLIWEQHPNSERYKREVFAKYFEGAINSGSAFLVLNAKNREVIGCTRYYDFDPADRSVCIGYTFVTRACWGLPYNRSMKSLMMEHAFRFADKVYFHIGDKNIRSQKAIAKLNAVKIGEKLMSYYGEAPHTNHIYCITSNDWLTSHPAPSP
jgi:RimJ/RimL family protein N-acetyltransferase